MDILCNRKQCVILNGEQSSWFKVLSGIPQGSILGPEICEVEDPGSKIYLYADDSKIYKVIRTRVTNRNYTQYCI